jgi:DNA-binding MurR/RpiR family transcriptional regulator
LAASAGVSPPTVVRFVSRLGYSGFPEFQKALVHEINEDMGSPLRQYEVRPPADSGGALSRARHVAFAALEATFDGVPEWEFERLVRYLADESREIRLVGGRFSRLLADYLTSHLQLIRPRVQFVSREELSRAAMVPDSGSSTVLIVFDYRRYDRATEQFAKAMKARGVTIALFTDTWLSPIAKQASIVLPCRVDSPSPFDSLVPAMALTEAVIAAVSEALGDAGRARLEQIEATHHSGD